MSNKWGFTVYADSEEDAEILRNYVANELTNHYKDVPNWDIDAEAINYGPEFEEEEPDGL